MSTPRFLILLAAALAFGASLWNGNVYDDYAIFSDPLLFAPSGWWEIFVERTRPITYLTFWAELKVTREPVILQHAVNLLLHLGAVWLAFDCLSRMLSQRAALIAALIVAVHPLQGETVNYIWARSTLLMAMFCLLSLRDWMRECRWRAVGWFGLALLAKEEAVTFPLVLLMLRPDWKPVAAMLALSIAAGARVLWVASTTVGSQAGAQAPYAIAEYFWTQGLVVLRYLSLIVWPVGLTPDPPISPGIYWWAWLLLVVACALLYKRYAWFVAGIVLLLPSSSVFPASELSADRRMYLPIVAFAAGAGILLQRWKAAPWVLAAVLIPLSVARARVWESDETLWTDALRKNDRSVRARLRLGSLALLEEARKLDPDNPQVAMEVGRVYVQAGRPDQALAEFGRALALAPNSPEALSNRGVALLLLKQSDAARQDFERALKIEPCFWDARYNLKRMGVQAAAPADCPYAPAQQGMLDELK